MASPDVIVLEQWSLWSCYSLDNSHRSSSSMLFTKVNHWLNDSRGPDGHCLFELDFYLALTTEHVTMHTVTPPKQSFGIV